MLALLLSYQLKTMLDKNILATHVFLVIHTYYVVYNVQLADQ